MFALMFLLGILRLTPTVAPGVLGYASDINTTDLLNETNKMRNEHGLTSLTINESLSQAAHSKAEHMFANDYWAHIAPDGTTPWDFILGVNYDYSYAGENLAKNFSHSDDVVDAWFNSPSHRENLLSPNYDEIGFAVVNGVLEGYETTLVVQMFGRPRSATRVAAIYDEGTLEANQEVTDQATLPVPPNEETAAEPVIKEETSQPAPAANDLEVTPVILEEEIHPAIDVTTATRTVTFTISAFLIALLALDIWYSKRKSIPKISGNAVAHIMFLVVMFVGVWFAISPGRIL